MLLLNEFDISPLTIEPEFTGCGIHSVLQSLIRVLELFNAQDLVQLHMQKLAHPTNGISDEWVQKAKYLLATIIRNVSLLFNPECFGNLT